MESHLEKVIFSKKESNSMEVEEAIYYIYPGHSREGSEKLPRFSKVLTSEPRPWYCRQPCSSRKYDIDGTEQ